MSTNNYFVIRAIKEKGVAASSYIAKKYKVKNVSATVSALRKRGHEIVTLAEGYALPFGTRDEAAKLSKTARNKIAKQFGLV
jgi:hypothetical protein